jgi:hypothetical protein
MATFSERGKEARTAAALRFIANQSGDDFYKAALSHVLVCSVLLFAVETDGNAEDPELPRSMNDWLDGHHAIRAERKDAYATARQLFDTKRLAEAHDTYMRKWRKDMAEKIQEGS